MTPSNQSTVITLLCLGGFALGWVDAICLTSLSVTLKDQRLIGTGVGVATSMRTVISTAAATVFTAIFSNRLASTIPSVVPPALLQAGLPESSISKFLTLLNSSPDQLESIPGANRTIIEVGLAAFKDANAQAYSTVYLSTLAFSGLGVIFSFVTPKIETLLTDEVSVRLKT